MRFLKLIIENYKTFQQKTEIDFTKGICEPSRNVYLIGGMNGSGKTAILEAIRVCLYGEKKAKIYNSINENSIKEGNTKCSINLFIQTDNEDILQIIRSWEILNERKEHISEDLEENLIIKINDEKLPEDKKSLQDYLNVMIPEGITRFFFFDGEKIQEIADDEYAVSRLRSSMETVLGLDLIQKLREDLESIIRKKRNDNSQITDYEVKLKEVELDTLRNRIKDKKGLCDELNEELNIFNEELSDKKSHFEKIFGFNIEGKQEFRSSKEKEKNNLNDRKAILRQETREWIETALPLALLGKYFSSLKTQIVKEREQKLKNIMKDIAEDLTDAILDEIVIFEKEFRDKALKKQELSELKSRILLLIRKFRPKNSKSIDVDEVLQLSDIDAQRIEIQIDELVKKSRSNLGSIFEEIGTIQDKIYEIEKELMENTVGEKDYDLYNQLQTEIISYSTQIGRKREELDNLRKEIEEINNDIIQAEKELDGIYDSYETSKKQTYFMTEVNKINRLLVEYAKLQREMKIEELQDYTYEMYRKLASKADLISRIDIDPNGFEVTILNDSGLVVKKQNLSAGEKEIFAISLLWGLSKTSELSLPIIIDTPLSRLDSQHRDSVIRQYLPSAGPQVIVLSTDTEIDKEYYRQIEGHLQNSIRLLFDKSNKNTTIKEGYFWRK